VRAVLGVLGSMRKAKAARAPAAWGTAAGGAPGALVEGAEMVQVRAALSNKLN
jgi:hypothetical protein